VVGIKLTILLLFVAVGLGGISASRLAPRQWASPVSLIAGGMIIFLAYEGFELIANAAEDVADPGRTLTRAYYICVVFVIVLYVLVAVVSVGALPVSALVHARDYALAEAARPATRVARVHPDRPGGDALDRVGDQRHALRICPHDIHDREVTRAAGRTGATHLEPDRSKGFSSRPVPRSLWRTC